MLTNYTTVEQDRTRGVGPYRKRIVRFPENAGPFLLIIIDTEEEFDWSTISRSECNVRAMRHQELAQRIFERYRIVPTYAVDYPVASQEDGYKPLLDFVKDGRCEIGAHLHPWVNPPNEEVVSERNSFPCNLPQDLEQRKVARLTETISANFGVQPILYKAGRYGADSATAMALEALGYQIDCSVRPWTDLSPMHGPDFSRYSTDLYWFGTEARLLEIPVTSGLIGLLRQAGEALYPWVGGRLASALKVTSVCARCRLLERIRVTPEGTELDDAKRLTRALLEYRGRRVFTITYHSPSLGIGHTPYVRDQRDLQKFLRWIEEYLEFFLGDIGGTAATPVEIYRMAQNLGGREERLPG
jgi:hypothetical protein